jgi:hypothetical protein
MNKDDYREKSVREFLEMINEPKVRENIRSGFLELLKLDGYTEEKIYAMKVKDAYDKLLEVTQETLWLIDMELQKKLKKPKH